MRLAEDKIKQGIMYPDREVRTIAIDYFSSSYTDDRTIMPLVVRAIETYGWMEGPFGYFYFHDGLPLTEETLRWLLNEVGKSVDDDRWPVYSGDMANLLAKCDAEMLGRLGDELIETLGKLERIDTEALVDRFQLLSVDSDACWQQLEEFCEREKDKQYVGDVPWDHALRLVEAIARNGEKYSDRLLSILQEEVEDHTAHPMGWMEPLAVRLAGEMRLESAVPLIIEKMHKDADLLNEECQRALARMGTDSTIEAVARAFETAPWHFRFLATSALGRVHSDLCVETCLQLIEREEDDEIRTHLARAALRHFAYEAIDPARQVIANTALSFGLFELRRHLLGVARVMEVEFPERELWEMEIVDDQELSGEKRGSPLSFDPDLDVDLTPEYSLDEPDEEPVPPPHTIVSEERTGRNWPCPCGSGKKFKKCCLRKQSGASLFN